MNTLTKKKDTIKFISSSILLGTKVAHFLGFIKVHLYLK